MTCMDVELHPKAAEELDGFESAVVEGLKERLNELEDNPAGHDDADPIRVGGRWVFRYRMKEERGGSIDHRAIYDIEDRTVFVYTIFYRDKGYEKGQIGRRF